MSCMLDTSVQVYETDRIEGPYLIQILIKNTSLTIQDMQLAVIGDRTPIAGRNRLLDDLKPHCRLAYFDRVEPNPRTCDVMAIMEDPAFTGCNVILGIGGGSVLDTAKALAMLAANSGAANGGVTNGGSLDEYLGNSPQRSITHPSLPLTLIPTTAGTGSEVTKVGVYTTAEGRKYTLGSPLMMAQNAVLSGEFLDGIPPALCASAGFDALDHALESIWNKNATPHTREIAEEAAVEVLTWLPRAYRLSLGHNDDDPALVRRMILRAACRAGTAFNITGTAAGHALSFILSEDWHIPHGTACACTLLDLFDLSAAQEETAASLGRLGARLFSQSGESSIASLRNHIADLMNEMNIPQTFAEMGIELTRQDIDVHFDRAFSDPKMHNHLPGATKDNIYPLLIRKCQG